MNHIPLSIHHALYIPLLPIHDWNAFLDIPQRYSKSNLYNLQSGTSFLHHLLDLKSSLNSANSHPPNLHIFKNKTPDCNLHQKPHLLLNKVRSLTWIYPQLLILDLAIFFFFFNNQTPLLQITHLSVTPPQLFITRTQTTQNQDFHLSME